ncbi:SMP-30/gluconolactonase/LRE family protein [Sphingomonas aliaeris]|uniref:SMP-30/gluconolactonase/LRE family protein n=1 Tax=Sphingomonas aliaeris TaxID=2759526 RepID=A0A974S4H4_9SPHN|nr:SMP-30/gluconolactonase/LRE family protein [Sphingomonas aliaeris]QQV77592.1 SMP-30/gluconolactonase/LRE family protein [Sphingomonas aliaeris]
MKTGDLQCIAQGLRFPEGPVFAPDGSLWCVEMRGGALARLTDNSRGKYDVERFDVGGEPNGLAIYRGKLWFCDAAGSIRQLDGALAPTIELPPEHPPLRRPNDLAFDSAGTLVFTCPGSPTEDRRGQVWCRNSAGGTSLLADGMSFPNGLAFTPDGHDLIVAETFTGILWRGAWEPDAQRWHARRPWATLPTKIGPDGIAFGPDGLLYVALYGRGEIHVVADDGSARVCLRTPGNRPTNLAFDPGGRLGLVITEAERGEMLACSLATLKILPGERA